MHDQLTAALRALEAPFRTLVDDSGWAHASMEGLVLDLGRWFAPTATTRLTPQLTFSVAASEAARITGGLYVEGYVWVDGHAEPAAWCGVGDQVVYGPEAGAYLGVPLAPHFCRRIQQRNGTAAVLMSKHPKLLPLLKDGLPRGAVLS
ncbi:hypothetical protein BBK82_29525 [Lentzea guizhouensis]|uniref:Uncharacterized protein n=1 Tax=Lentzea guizhouensis TaxID=1586287 RepID=A0A1B2HPC0_9PSEU|nr:hypothetical protein [Lentzea guizhouensis]ANZ39573.1 hypothetical protein BBK82_29525 [Lentzea guizhouensis]